MTYSIWTHLHSPSHRGFTWNLASIGLAVSKEKKFENVEFEWPWTNVNEWPWPLNFIEVRVLIELSASTNFDITDYNSFWRINCFTFFPYKSIRGQIWPCRKLCEGQPKVIIWTNLVVREHPMLYTKFQRHRQFASKEEDFNVFYHIWAYRSTVTWDIWTNVCSPISWRLHVKFGFNRPSGFKREDVWKYWRRTTDDVQKRTTEACLYYKLRWAKYPRGNILTNNAPPKVVSVECLYAVPRNSFTCHFIH